VLGLGTRAVTIAISIKVNDGVVLAADSAGSLVAQVNNTPVVVQVYNNANKVFNLRKGLPIGALSWGVGAIGKASISTLLKDLRARFSGTDANHPDWHLDPQTYTVEQVAIRVREFLFDEHYVPIFASWTQKPVMGLIVAGYGAGCGLADEYKIEIDANGVCNAPVLVRPTNECGAMWSGEPEAITRLLTGHSPALAGLLSPVLAIPEAQFTAAIGQIQAQLSAQLLNDAMPIKDAIDVAEFLVELTCKFSRYTPGAATVGGPVEIAAITKHEGFKWVTRKFYFTQDLNPEANT
jgi:hypothetical protein